jgi:rhodanese-related sulfurtransferase
MVGFLSRLFGRSSPPQFAWIEAGELRQRLSSGDRPLLVDVRQPGEFTSPPGHLPGALNVPLAQIGPRSRDLAAQGRPIVLICKSDRRSVHAAAHLIAAGVTDVAVLRGGTDGWHRLGFSLQ